ncbi:MAG: phosphoenolpyruvate--protein phosphotransferase [Bacteroidetes bacterium]|nr:phosphoenolpyruvate--protein phosphotransferase [Bacteroidota bacterium]
MQAALEMDIGETQVLQGLGVSPGIAIGPVHLYARASFAVEHRELAEDEIEAEVEHFEWAVTRAEHNLGKILTLAREKLGDESVQIFDAQMLMLRDEALYQEVVHRIRNERYNADYAVMVVMTQHRQRVEASEDEYLRDRANDLQDVQDRLVMHLRRGKHLSTIDPDTIVVSEYLTAADLMLFSRRGILGCALDRGGATSHVSIMARALGIPAVVSLHGRTDVVRNDDLLIVDGIEGRVIVNPDEATLATYRTRQERYRRLLLEHEQLAPLAETLDHHRVCLRANVEFMEELDVLEKHGAEGIGLLRTEVLLLMKGEITLDEEIQFEGYKQVVQAVAPEPTTFRLLDLGGDKMLPVAHREPNPFLGWRGIRVLLDKPEILRPQVRAVLRASAFGPARLLLPMVTNIDELRRFRQFLDQIKPTVLLATFHSFDRPIKRHQLGHRGRGDRLVGVLFHQHRAGLDVIDPCRGGIGVEGLRGVDGVGQMLFLDRNGEDRQIRASQRRIDRPLRRLAGDEHESEFAVRIGRAQRDSAVEEARC